MTITDLHAYLQQRIDAGGGDEPLLYPCYRRVNMEVSDRETIPHAVWQQFVAETADDFEDEVAHLAWRYWKNRDVARQVRKILNDPEDEIK